MQNTEAKIKKGGSKKVKPEVAPAPKEIVQPVVPESEVTDANDAAKKKRVSNNVTGIHIARARCEWHLRNFISDEDIDNKIKELKDAQKSLTADEEIASNKNKIDELNKQVIRISHNAPSVLSVVSDTMVKDLIRFGFSQLIQSGKKTLDVSYFYSNDIKSSRYYSLFSSLPSYTSSAADTNVAAGAKNDVGDNENDDSSDNMTFNTYITEAINDIKKDFEPKIIIGKKVKKYLSNLVIELIRRVSVITKSLLKTIINVRTIVPNHIKEVIRILLLDGNSPSDEIDNLMNLIDDKIKQIQEIAKTEKAPNAVV